MNPPIITSAEQGAKLDMQTRAETLASLYNQVSPTDQLRIGRKLNNSGYQTPAPGSSALVPITSSSLAPATGYSLPQSEPMTGVDGIIGSVGAFKDSQVKQNDFQAQLDAEKAKAAAAKSSTGGDLQSLIEQEMGVYGSRAQLEADAGIDQKSQTVVDVTNEIDQLQRAQENEIRALQARGDITKEAAEGLIFNVKAKYTPLLADKYIIQNVANRNLIAAQEMVERKIKSQLEPIQAKLKWAEKFYDENESNLDDATKNALENKIRTDTREYESEQTRLQALEKAKLEAIVEAQSNGAGADVLANIQRATTPEEAYANAGQYIGLLDRRLKNAQLAKLNQADGPAAPTVKTINGVDMQWNPSTGRWEKIDTGFSDAGNMTLATTKSNVDLISNLSSDKYLGTAVGPNPLARMSLSNWATGGKSNFVAGIEQIRSQLNLDALIQAKARGATFGALSDQELQVLSSSASKIGTWAIKDDEGNIKGYKASQADFKKELDKINNFAKLDYIIKGGDPMDVGAQMMNDGSIWAYNSDGTFTQIK